MFPTNKQRLADAAGISVFYKDQAGAVFHSRSLEGLTCSSLPIIEFSHILLVEVIGFIKRLLWSAGFDYSLHCFSFFAGLCMVAEKRSMNEPLPNATLAELHRTWDAFMH